MHEEVVQMSGPAEDNIDTCRICSGPAEPNQPLFHPCKCSGTIRYIHQDCLTTWLSHSRKKTCDVCKAEYSFEKVYAPDMPARLPAVLFLKRLAGQLVHWQLLSLRAVFVTLVWLALVPYLTVQVWRMYFWAGEGLAWATFDEPRPPHLNPPPVNSSAPSNSSILDLEFSFLRRTFRLTEVMANVSADIFTGQIIASLIIIVFLAVFLLREWIVQNARPGVFGDAAVDGLPIEGELADGPLGPGEELLPPLEPVAPVQPIVPVIPTEEDAPMLATQSVVFPQIEAPTNRSLEDPSDPSDEDVDFPGIEAEREYVRRQREHYFRLKGASSRSLSEASETEFSGAGPSRVTLVPPSSEGLKLNPAMVRLPPSPRPRSTDIGTSPRAMGKKKGRPSSTAPPSRKRTRSAFDDDLEPSPTKEKEAIDWMANTQFTVNIPPGWKLSTSSTGSSSPHPAVASSSRASSTALSESSRPSSTSWDVVSPSSATDDDTSMKTPSPTTPAAEAVLAETEVLQQPLVQSTDPSVATEDSDGTLRNTTQMVDRAPSSLPPLKELSASAYASAFAPYPPPSAPSSTPRRPPLPPTTPNDEFPPPSPRPSHARPSPLPKAGFLSQRIDLSSSAPNAPSPLQNIASSSSPISLGATYRAPEDIAVNQPVASTSSYFPPLDVIEASAEAPTETDNGLWVDVDDESSEDMDVPDDFFLFGNPKFAPQPDPPQIDLRPLPPPNGPDQAQPAPPPPAPPPAVALDPPNNEGNLEEAADQELPEEDFDGLFEAVGMRGPLLSLLQNVSLMIFILDLTIAVAVFIPFVLGKSLALNMMKPSRLLFVLHLPIKGVRLLTDPVVDGILWFIRPAVAHLYGMVIQLWKIKPQETTTSTVDMNTVYIQSLLRLKQFTPSFFQYSKSSQSVSKAPLLVRSLSFIVPPMLLENLDVHGLQAKRIAYLSSFASAWRRLATEDGPTEKVFAIWIGYVGIITGSSLFLSSGVMFSGATRFIRNVITQQLVVLKVAFFIFIELLIFPLGCGVVLDLSTLPLFPDSTLRGRVLYASNAPVAAIFFHWMIGTMFMYQFALILAHARAQMRKGALWFVKDPQDPSFHPIRDILDRPTMSQLRKLGVSALMYGMVIALGVGAGIYGVKYLWTPFYYLLPLRLNSRHPISEIPIDLLFLHIVFPLIVKHMDLVDRLTPFLHEWWDRGAHELRLSSFLLGERIPQEEFASQYSWKRLPLIRDLEWVKRNAAPELPDDGGFARVPASDSVALPEPHKKMLVPTNEAGTPLDEAGVEAMASQDEAARKAHRDPAEDYQIVYIPPHHQRRVFAFVGYIWTTALAMAVTAFGTPIFVGRLVLDFIPGVPIHDGYSFLLGVTLLWLGVIIFKFGRSVYLAIRQEHTAVQARLHQSNAGTFERVKSWAELYLGGWLQLTWTGLQHLALWTMLAFVIPLLMATVFQLYILLPLRTFIYPTIEGTVPTLHVWEDWALGCLFAVALVRMNPPENQAQLIRNGEMRRPNEVLEAWWNFVGWLPDDIDFGLVFYNLIGPLTGGLLGLIILPPSLFTTIHQLLWILHLSWMDDFQYRNVYPILFVGTATVLIIDLLRDTLVKWAQTVRDSEYLVDLRLRNMEDKHAPKAEPAEPPMLEPEEDMPPVDPVEIAVA
ncbi:hypothetical protein DL93DRAFT_323184 [Clavulina sp. PMI_390]|nr:hypothetical protein DL93DRAFT_323184 [Clavulina sp. PMI_390]